MSDTQQKLVDIAREKFGTIYPCGGSGGWDKCFTRYKGRVVFWFNTEDNSTHIEQADEK
jgi:hypothetical protein